MSFVTTEQWPIEPRGLLLSIGLPRDFDDLWLRRFAAFGISIVIDGAIVAALFVSGSIPLPVIAHPDSAITVIDLPSPTNLSNGASAKQPLQPAVTPVIKSPIDTTVAPPAPKEWSITTLPLAPSVSLRPPAPPASTKAGTATGTAGVGQGAGYDPYAFASLQKPPPGQATSGASLHVDATALARLEALLGERFHSDGQIITARISVDATGRVTSADIGPPVEPTMAAVMARSMTGFVLCAADPARGPSASGTISLRL
jgi:hypothetical protein